MFHPTDVAQNKTCGLEYETICDNKLKGFESTEDRLID